MPELSIIVTTYNIEKYVEQSLHSVIAQTFTDTEIIVVDDGSSDGTPEIIESFAAIDSRVKPVLLRENTVGGVATAANTGLDLATGRYVGFVDGDDFCEPTMFAALHEAITQQNADLAMCQYKLLDDNDDSLSDPADQARWGALEQDLYPLSVEERKRFLAFVAVPWRKLYRRELLDLQGIRFPVGDYFYEDNPFHWFAILTARSLAVVPEVLCYHRVQRAGQTMQTADARLFRIFSHHDTIHAWLDDRGLTHEYAANLLGWAISQMEWIAPRTPRELHRELFDVMRSVVSQYDDAVVGRALAEGRKGQLTRVLVEAVNRNNYAGFVKALSAGPTSANPLVSAMYHLRYSGVQETARLTGRYTRERLGRYRSSVALQRESSHQTSNDDIMMALVILDRRLTKLEAAVRDLNDR